MKTAIEKFIPYLMVGLLLFSLGGTRGELVDRIVALVNNEIITSSEVEETGRRFFDQVEQSTSPSEREEKLREARKAILNQLIENKLLDQEIRSKKIEVPDREVDAAIQELMAHNHFTENDLKKALARDGLTYSYYRQRIREDLGKMHLVNREIKSKIVIKEEELRKTYNQNLKEYTDQLEVKVQQIFSPIPQGATEDQITTIRKEAQAVLEKARQGEDFAQLARNHSKGPEASEGGVLGFFKPKELRPELEEAAFRMKPGELSSLIKSPEGFHILRVMERKGGEPKPFAEVQDKIRDEMVRAEAERQFREWMKTLRAKAYIDVRL